MVSEMPLLWLSDKLWIMFSLKIVFFDLNDFFTSYILLLLLFFFSCPTFIISSISFWRSSPPIFTIDCCPFFHLFFYYYFFLRSSWFFFASYYVFSVHNFYEPYKWCVRSPHSTQYRKVNINLPNWLFIQILNSVWMKSSPLLMNMMMVMVYTIKRKKTNSKISSTIRRSLCDFYAEQAFNHFRCDHKIKSYKNHFNYQWNAS